MEGILKIISQYEAPSEHVQQIRKDVLELRKSFASNDDFNFSHGDAVELDEKYMKKSGYYWTFAYNNPLEGDIIEKNDIKFVAYDVGIFTCNLKLANTDQNENKQGDESDEQATEQEDEFETPGDEFAEQIDELDEQVYIKINNETNLEYCYETVA